MKISLIVAASANNVIGIDGGLPWHLSADLKRFKAITMGKPMIMGRATFDSIGKSLPGRKSIVMSRKRDFVAAGCEVVGSVEEALLAAGAVDEVMIIGGGKIYELFMPQADRIYLTRVDTHVAGDTYFPQFSDKDWEVVATENYAATLTQEFAFSLHVLERRRSAS